MRVVPRKPPAYKLHWRNLVLDTLEPDFNVSPSSVTVQLAPSADILLGKSRMSISANDAVFLVRSQSVICYNSATDDSKRCLTLDTSAVDSTPGTWYGCLQTHRVSTYSNWGIATLLMLLRDRIRTCWSSPYRLLIMKQLRPVGRYSNARKGRNSMRGCWIKHVNVKVINFELKSRL